MTIAGGAAVGDCACITREPGAANPQQKGAEVGAVALGVLDAVTTVAATTEVLLAADRRDDNVLAPVTKALCRLETGLHYISISALIVVSIYTLVTWQQFVDGFWTFVETRL
jgi:hypothetical protein